MNITEPTATTGVPVPVPRARPRHHPLFGGLLVREGLINQAQLDKALAVQQSTEPRPLLGQMLLDQKLVTPHELNAVLAKYRRTHLLGDVLIETKAITPAQLERALAIQRESHGPLGDTLVQLGLITEWSLKHALSIQLRIPLVDLDDRAIDPGMTSAVSERYARHHRVIPIDEKDGRIVVAMDDPTDVEVVAEIRACTGREIEVVVATADALERALGRLYRGRSDETAARPPSTEEGDTNTRVPLQTTMQGAGAPAHPSGPDSDASPHARDEDRPRSGFALDAIRARMDAIRQVVRSWDRWTDAAETLLHERSERRAEIDRLTGELEEVRAALARTNQELEAKAHALAGLESAHAALLRSHEGMGSAFAALRERHDALLRDREFAIDRVSQALQRLRF
jgi:hypothetical protein